LSAGSVLPVINTGGSFIGLQSSITVVGSIATVAIYWISYSKQSPQDGLSFVSTPYYNEPSINITQFAGIPLALMTGTHTAAFYQFAGQITATDVPTIPNHSLNSCFYGSTATNFGNIAGWDVSQVTDLTSTFENSTSFNSPLDKWNTQNVTSMINLFNNCSSFTQDISSWNFHGLSSNISNGNMYNILYGTGVNPPRTSKFLISVITQTNP